MQYCTHWCAIQVYTLVCTHGVLTPKSILVDVCPVHVYRNSRKSIVGRKA